jgi:hypothetical protein
VVPDVETYRTYRLVRPEAGDPLSLERGVRQLLADKISGNLVGLWLLIPEHLRLGTWDLLLSWTRQPPETVAPRLALQMVHEAALCVSGLRQARSLSQRGFELTNGLPFLASDSAIHDLLQEHTVAEAQELQVRLGVLRRARGHFRGQLLVIDPHRLRSYSRRQMPRFTSKTDQKPVKVGATFFCLDPDTGQPVCFTSGSSALTVSQATPDLLDLAARILNPDRFRPLVLADAEHASAALVDEVTRRPFDLLVPQASTRAVKQLIQSLPPTCFTPCWAGFALAKLPYRLKRASSGPHFQLVQRSGERPEEFHYKSFLCTRDTPEVDELTLNYPKRWHVEEFFNTHQHQGWYRAGTQNRHIRYGQMSLALIAQAALHQLRQRIGPPWSGWDAPHLAKDLFRGVDGDIRVHSDTILVTFYKLPGADLLQPHYQGLPAKLQSEGIDPRIPWLYNFKLDFRFK